MQHFYGGLRGRLIISISALVLLSVAYFAWFAAKQNTPLSPLISFVAGVGLLFMLLMPVSIYFQSKKVFESDKLLAEEQVFDFRDDGFSVSAAYGNSEITWDKVFKAAVTKEFISVYLSEVRAFVLPARFLSREDYDSLKKIITQKAGKPV